MDLLRVDVLGKKETKQDERKEKSTSVFLFYLYTPMIEAQVAPALWQLKKKKNVGNHSCEFSYIVSACQ